MQGLIDTTRLPQCLVEALAAIARRGPLCTVGSCTCLSRSERMEPFEALQAKQRASSGEAVALTPRLATTGFTS